MPNPINSKNKRDKYSAVWVSYSGLNTFLQCPRAYYLQYVYKNPETRRKMAVITPQLALGQVVHDTLEPLANVPAEKRMDQPIIDKFEENWMSVSGEKGGFSDADQEIKIKARGREMIERVIANPGPIVRKAVRIPKSPSGMPPNFLLSEEENIILCGSIDWLEYLEDSAGVHIIDFKTGKNSEQEDSLQLPIYLLLATNLQSRPVERASYWYLNQSSGLEEKNLLSYDDARSRVTEKAIKLKEARESSSLECPRGGKCFACAPFEAILEGEAKYVGVSSMNKDTYVIGID